MATKESHVPYDRTKLSKVSITFFFKNLLQFKAGVN